MSLSVEVRFDNPERVYRAGEVVAGEVILNVGEPVSLKKVGIEILWHTMGKGTEEQSVIASKTALEGRSIDVSQRLPFRAKLPLLPLSYAGHLISIYWVVRVEVTAAQRLRANAEERFTVVAPAATSV